MQKRTQTRQARKTTTETGTWTDTEPETDTDKPKHEAFDGVVATVTSLETDYDPSGARW